LVVAAHPDDEVLGCGGTIARLSAAGARVHIVLMADGESSRLRSHQGQSVSEQITARAAAADAACTVLGGASVDVLSLPDNRMDETSLLDVVQLIEGFVGRYQPRAVLTHHSGDVNIDHRVVHDAVVAACRPVPNHCVKELLFFEIPSSTEWRPPASAQPFTPNCFVDISATLEKKLEALQVYASELREFPHPRSLQAVEALAKWRGATVGVTAGEAFVLGRRLY
jgi:LmbE family N-acetylglucosaminyl deacetylase